MRLVARSIKGIDGGKGFDGMTIVQMALRMHALPDEIERMDIYWYNRLHLYFEAEAAAEKL